jgi:sugar lactone lactonase YvrE
MRNNVGADGSEGDAGGTDGVLQRIDPDGTITEWRRELGISNTIAWSPDQTRFYSADTLLNELRVYDYDNRTGAIDGERPFLRDFPRGSPDGSTVDSEGYVWNCRYGGGCIVRLAPDGTIDRLVEMPTKNVTTCTFGGPDLRTLYVTTAAGSVPANQVAGGLFAIETEAPGQPENRFRVFGM